jgi:hypothetical protein
MDETESKPELGDSLDRKCEDSPDCEQGSRLVIIGAFLARATRLGAPETQAELLLILGWTRNESVDRPKGTVPTSWSCSRSHVLAGM